MSVVRFRPWPPQISLTFHHLQSGCAVDATGKIKATNKPFKDDWVFAITVRNDKLTNIREYIDTQALARASEMDASGLA